MNWVKYVYIDESGDLGKYGSKYFAVAAVLVGQPKILSRIMKRLRERKLKKKLRQLPEIKANNSNREIREYVLNQVRSANCEIYAIVVEKSKIFDYLYEVKDKLYNYICGKLVDRLNVSAGKLIITVDKKHTNTLFRTDFDNYIGRKLAASPGKLEIEIYHSSSYSTMELQVVDFIVWSINRKFNSGDESYFKIIENKIVNKEEMILWQ
uniref:DUF3800 domain-containing protein n=1 Tax=candidate division WOR-3 bacterium TaxID=2052148 RepID=A0A7V3NVN2_UNCW3